MSAPEEAGRVEGGYRVYGYRWVVLGAFVLVNITIQLLWISYAAITSQAQQYYGISGLQVGLFAMLFMILFIPFALPAAWLIDTRGFRVAVGFGATLMAICGIGRGLAGDNYGLAIAATVGIAIGQPFLLNAWTKVPANWMAPNERATGVALATLANLVGIALGEALTPMLISSMSIGAVQLVYGVVVLLSAILFVAVARERPATPPCAPELEVRALMLDGLRSALRVRAFLAFLAVWFIGLGIFNGVLTWVDEILSPRHFSSVDAGIVGALVIVGGVFGSVTLASLSDRQQKRVVFMLIGLLLAIPGLLGLTFAGSGWLLYVASFAFGFFLISVAPIGMEFSAEVTQPTPEGTSQGVVQLVGQCSVVVVYLMAALKSSNGSYTTSLLFCVGLLVVGAIVLSRLHDPTPAASTEGRPVAGRSQPRVA